MEKREEFEPIKIMISSTIKNMLPDRKAVINAFSGVPFVQVIGAEPIRIQTYAYSPYLTTIDMAKGCDFYILLLGCRYGYKTQSEKSATEVEFEAAYEDNPTKILIFQKECSESELEEEQRNFIGEVSDYYKGYWITKYSSLEDLKKLVIHSFFFLLKERASIGFRLNYFDHFVRCAIQRIPAPDVRVFYSVNEDVIELKYKIFGNLYFIHFKKEEIYKDFWGCIAYLEEKIGGWVKSG